MEVDRSNFKLEEQIFEANDASGKNSKNYELLGQNCMS